MFDRNSDYALNKNVSALDKLEGMASTLSAVLMISASRVITAILTDGNTMDTILRFHSASLTEMPKIVLVLVMFSISATQLFKMWHLIKCRDSMENQYLNESSKNGQPTGCPFLRRNG